MSRVRSAQRFVPPLAVRELKAMMALKHLRLAEVAKAARVHYTAASELLNGTRRDPFRFDALRKVIEQAPMPEVTV